MFTSLSTRRLLFDASFERSIDLATRHGFEGIDPSVHLLIHSTAERRGDITAAARNAGLRWGVGTIPFRISEPTDEEFEASAADFPAIAAMLSEMGVTTLGTWFPSAGDIAPYDQNFARHVDRLDRLAPILLDNGLRLALEYVGPRTWRTGKRFEFVHDLAGMRSIIAATNEPRAFGLLLDAFHWYTAEDTVDGILALGADEVLAVDLDDAPVGVPVAEQRDMHRAQPCETGTIDTPGFVGALRSIGFTGAVMSEPFSDHLLTQSEDDRVRDARAGLRAALGA